MEITEKMLRDELVLTPQDMAELAESADSYLTRNGRDEVIKAVAGLIPDGGAEELPLADRIELIARGAYKLGYLAAATEHNKMLNNFISGTFGAGEPETNEGTGVRHENSNQ